MNILFITDNDVSPYSGGIERVAFTLASYFSDKSNIKCYLAYRNKDCSAESIIFAKKCKLHIGAEYDNLVEFIKDNAINVLFSHLMKAESLRTLMPILGKVKKEHKILHIALYHNMPSYELKKISINALFYRLKHGQAKNAIIQLAKQSLFSFLGSNLSMRFLHKKYRYAYDNSDKLIMLDQSYIPLYAKCAGISVSDKFAFIPNALPFKENDTNPLITKGNNVLVVARLEEKQKRISDAILIWKNIEDEPELRNWTLTIVGYGEDEHYYKSLIKRYGLKRIAMVGQQNSLPYYQKASIFMMTSTFEGFPMVLVEALQSKVVPIAFDSFSAVNSIINNNKNGFIIKEHDLQSYSKTLSVLMKDKTLLKELSSNSNDTISRYSLNRIGEQWINLLSKNNGTSL